MRRHAQPSGRSAVWTTAAALLMGLVLAPSAVGHAQEIATAEAWATPTTVTVEGEIVAFTIEIVVPDTALPVTITAVSSDLHGDVADAENPSILSTTCSVPVEYLEGAPGWEGWWCRYEAWVEGEPGELVNTIAATVRTQNGTELAVSDTATVTLSDQLGGITGTLIDADTGLPISDTWVWGQGDAEEVGGLTDATGTFSFAGLEPGEYRLVSGSTPPGGRVLEPAPDYTTPYAMEWYDEDPRGPADGSGMVPVAVLPGEITDVVWELSVGGAIEGSLRDAATGEPVVDAEIYWWIRDDGGQPSPWEVGGYASVSDDGRYRIEALRGGDYMVCFDSPLGSECWDDQPMLPTPITSQGDVIPVSLGQTATGFDAIVGEPIDSGDDGGGGDGSGADGAIGQPEPTLPATGFETVALLLTATALLGAGATALLAGARRRSAAR